MIRELTINVAIIALLGLGALQVALAQNYRPMFPGSPTNVENFVQEMFFVTQSSGSLALRGTCMATDVASDVVSDALPHPPEGPFHNIDEPLAALSQVAPHLSWIRDGEGMLRVRDDRVQDDVLRIRLQRVHFRGAVHPDDAVQDVLSAPEVRAYFRKNHIEVGLVFRHLAPLSTKGLPRLSGDLRDVTVAEALDHVVRYFPGLWVYKECANGSLRRVMVRVAAVRVVGAPSSGGRVGAAPRF